MNHPPFSSFHPSLLVWCRVPWRLFRYSIGESRIGFSTTGRELPPLHHRRTVLHFTTGAPSYTHITSGAPSYTPPLAHRPTPPPPQVHRPALTQPEEHRPTLRPPQAHRPTLTLPQAHRPTLTPPQAHRPALTHLTTKHMLFIK